MPRSSKAPPLPPEPNYSEIIQNDVARIKRLLGLDVNRLALGSDVEGIIVNGPFGTVDYTITGVSLIELVGVTTSLGPAQGGSGFPAQVTGLTVTPQAGSNTQLNLAWTATSLPAEFNHYNVYRGTISGFTIGPSAEIAEPVTNSYNNTGLIAGTTYYYRVSTTNDADLEGAASSQVSGTTTGTTPILPSILLHFDNDFIDSANNVSFAGGTSGGFITPGVFGTHAALFNTTGTPPNTYVRSTNWGNPNNTLDMTVGFSISLWIYPTDLSALDERRIVVEYYQDANNMYTLQLRSDGTLMFFVKKAGVDYKRQKGGFVTGSWQHIGAVFNGSSNTVEVYKDGVAGIASTQTTEYPTNPTQGLMFSFRFNETLDHYYEGRMDEFQYFKSRVLTPTQITNLMNTNST